MLRKILTIAFVTAILFAIGCKPKEKAPETPAPEATQAEPNAQ